MKLLIAMLAIMFTLVGCGWGNTNAKPDDQQGNSSQTTPNNATDNNGANSNSQNSANGGGQNGAAGGANGGTTGGDNTLSGEVGDAIDDGMTAVGDGMDEAGNAVDDMMGGENANGTTDSQTTELP